MASLLTRHTESCSYISGLRALASSWTFSAFVVVLLAGFDNFFLICSHSCNISNNCTRVWDIYLMAQ